MSALSRILRDAESGIPGTKMLMFWCPGCECTHGVLVRTGEGPCDVVWGWNGSVDAPTFAPSVLVRWFKTSELGERQIRERSLQLGQRADGSDVVCHSFVVAGQIQFLADCTHALAGQTVPLPAWTEPGE